jgi:integrase
MPTVYTPDEMKAILAAADPYMRLVINLGLKCGLREQELMHLEWGDIHWAEKVLRVAGKPHWGFRVKDSEQREVPIADEVLELLEARRSENPDTALVLGTHNAKPNTKLLRTLKRLAKRAGLNCKVCEGCRGNLGECGHWTLHKLRRTYATTLLRNNIDLSTVQHYMGHADLASTMRYLRPASGKQAQAAVNAIKWS